MNPNFLGSLAIFSLVTVNAAQSQDYPIEPVGDVHNILPLWEQAKVMERQLRQRKQTVLPEVMTSAGVDMWLVSRDQRVLYLSLVTANDEGFVSERPDVLVFFDKGENHDIEALEEDFERLSGIVRSRDPKKIAVSNEARQRLAALVEVPFGNRMISSEGLRDAFLEIRMELDTVTSVPEWGGQDARIVLEQSVAFTRGELVFLGGRETEHYLIK